MRHLRVRLTSGCRDQLLPIVKIGSKQPRMSRFASNPKWLIYLPPTMSPCETSSLPGLLEHPAEAFAYFRGQGVAQVICEEKHMGSRAVLVICRDELVARERFGVSEGEFGIVARRRSRQDTIL